MRSLLILPAILACIPLGPATANWSHDPSENTAITVAPLEQGGPSVCCACDGSTVVAWHSEPWGHLGWRHIYAQRLDVEGAETWGPEGIELWSDIGFGGCNSLYIADSGRAVFIGTDDYHEHGWEARCVDASGYEVWEGGMHVSDKSIYGIAEDSSGGAFMALIDRGDDVFYDVWAQHMDRDGRVLWPVDEPGPAGVLVCGQPGTQSDVAMIKDGLGGAIFAWEDDRAGHLDIYAQKLDSSGQPEWEPDGAPICVGDVSMFDAELLSDCQGGAFVAWSDRRGDEINVYAQRVNASGDPMWTHNGIGIAVAPYVQMDHHVLPDGEGGAIIVWGRGGGDGFIRAQRVDGSGNRLWAPGGVAVCPYGGYQSSMDAVGDGEGGVIVVWITYDGQRDIHAQRLDRHANPIWGAEGIAVSSAAGNQWRPEVASDGAGNAVVVWLDERSGELDIYAQRIDAHGYLGWPGPHSLEMEDVPGDQGGVVELTWRASYLDTLPGGVITEYAVWRTADCARDWELLAHVAADGSADYSLEAPTLGDSTACGTTLTGYRITARAGDHGASWTGSSATGYSVDNLTPGVPVDLEARSLGRDVLLVWSPSGYLDDDLSAYNIYRGEGEQLPAGEMVLLSATPDTFFTDPSPGTGTWHYRVTAVDVHGNESESTPEVSATIVPAAYALRPGYPNPFGQSARIEYDLPADVHVQLKVFSVGGRLVRVLRDGLVPAGRRREVWDGRDRAGNRVASGVYYCRLEAPGFDRTIRITFLN